MRRTTPLALIFALLFGTIVVAEIPTATASPTSFYNDCGAAAVVKPKSITQFCADAGAGVTNIKWSSWKSTAAKGSGTYYINSCDPSCVSGKIYKSSVVVELSGLTKTHGKNYLMKVTVLPAPGKSFNWPPKMNARPASVKWITDFWQG